MYMSNFKAYYNIVCKIVCLIFADRWLSVKTAKTGCIQYVEEFHYDHWWACVCICACYLTVDDPYGLLHYVHCDP